MDGDKDKKIIGIKEAAKMLGVSPDTLRRWDQSGYLTALRRGPRRDRFYFKEDIEARVADLFREAKRWVTSQQKTENIDPQFYCENSAVFQARLSKLQAELAVIHGMETFYPLVVAVTGEIGNNSFDHNLGVWPSDPGVFFGYALEKEQIILADKGQGILATLRRVKPDLSNHAEALKIAFTQTLSGRSPERRGNGLKFVREAVTGNPMKLVFYTGDAKLTLWEGMGENIEITDSDFTFQGCLAVITFESGKKMN